MLSSSAILIKRKKDFRNDAKPWKYDNNNSKNHVEMLQFNNMSVSKQK